MLMMLDLVTIEHYSHKDNLGTWRPLLLQLVHYIQSITDFTA